MFALVCVIAVIFAGSGGYWVTVERSRRARRLAARRDAWGKPGAEARETESVSRYHELRRQEQRPGVLEESAWRDLGMGAVFTHLDRAETFAGRARLYDRLRVPSIDLPALRRFDEVVTVFQRDIPVRERVQSVLASGDPYGEDTILEVLFARLPRPSPMRHVFPVVACLTVAALAAIPFSPVAGLIALTFAALSIALRVAHGRRMLGWMAALRAASALLGVAGNLGALSVAGLGPDLAAIRAARRRLSTLARASAWLTVDTLRGNEILLALVAYVNAFLLVDLTALAYCFSVLGRKRDDVRALFQSVGDLDAALAVASFREGATGYGRPEIDPAAKALCIEDAVHPLVADPVPNSVRVEGRGMIITGPNMSGKSTFVRTVAINAVLAQTVYTTLARGYRAPLLRVRTLMDAEDDAHGGRSYYYAEVEGAKALLEPGEPGARTLVIVDELFRGTNTSERIGAGKAVLAALHEKGHYVLASTHDRELVSLLRDGYDPYHFGEQVIDGQLVFPFTLCPGPSTTRNAIALLQQAGFPKNVIADAIQVTDELERERV
jgi:hypothetical protein